MIAAFLADGETVLRHVRHCKDTLDCHAALNALTGSGQPFKDIFNVRELRINGSGGEVYPSALTINCGESGFALRALASVSALSGNKIILTGEGSLPRRPVDFFAGVLSQLNVNCNYRNNSLPLEIKGPLQFRNIEVDGSLSSQFLSGLLMVFPFAKEDHVIEVSNLKSKNYVDLTIQVMNDFGISVNHESHRRFFIPGNQRYSACATDVEGDWSSASAMLVAGATSGSVTISNLNMDSLQPDKAILGVLKMAGAGITINSNSVTVEKGKLKSFSFDATDCPDLFPALVALAICCDGRSEITGVERLIHKESNRVLALQQEFSKLNRHMISIDGNKIILEGGLTLQSAHVNSHNDHRIAMSLAVAGLNVEGGIQISGAESVDKSFPGFFTDLVNLISIT